MNKKKISFAVIIIVAAVAALFYGTKIVKDKKIQQKEILKEQLELSGGKSNIQVIDEERAKEELKKLEEMQAQQGVVQFDEKTAQSELEKLKEAQKEQAVPPITEEDVRNQLKKLEEMQKTGK